MSDESITTETTSSSPEGEGKQQAGFRSSLQFFDSILNRLAGLVQLTEKEQHDAGIYLGDQK